MPVIKLQYGEVHMHNCQPIVGKDRVPGRRGGATNGVAVGVVEFRPLVAEVGMQVLQRPYLF